MKAKIQAKSHILTLLGDELIGSDALAIFELVKNAYDADAENVKITMTDIGQDTQTLIIEDNGHGMALDTLKDVWLTIGTDFKRGLNRKESKKGRVSLGNKGVGRLAVHKIASDIELLTKTIDSDLVHHLTINWKDLINSSDYVQNLEVEINSKDSKGFPFTQGTIIKLTNFKENNWNKTKVRNFFRKISTIKPYFKSIQSKDNFNIEINLGDKNEWIKDVLEPSEILDKALFTFYFTLDYRKDKSGNVDEAKDAKFKWKYIFNNADETISNDERYNKNQSENSDDVLDVKSALNKFYEGAEDSDKKRNLLNTDLEGIGKVQGEFYIFNLDKNITNLFFSNQIQPVKSYIAENYGIRIYRDGVRVFNYGEQNDDWLGLDYQKIQRAGEHFSRKVTLGAINLSLKDSHQTLIEKTNREGFVDNIYFEILKEIISKVFNFFEIKSLKDKDLINEYIDGFKPIKKIGLSETISELEEKINEKGLEKEFKNLFARIRKDYDTMKDVMLNSGQAGLNLGIIFHEVDRELIQIDKRLDKLNDKSDVEELEKIQIRVKGLLALVQSFSPMLKQAKGRKEKISNVLSRLKVINDPRFQQHEVIFSCPILTGEAQDFEVEGQINLILTSINNIIDNAIYWLGYNNKAQDRRALLISSDTENFFGNAVIIADNGPGFSLDMDYMTQPFVTTKDGSMGLGLYLTNTVIESLGGKLQIIDSADYEGLENYNGACIALIFPKSKV